MNPLLLSNLTVRSNLLCFDTFQRDLFHLSVFEMRDIHRRFHDLDFTIPPAQQQEYREALFWGDGPSPLLNRDWPNHVAQLDQAVAALEERPDRELAFELLALVRWDETQPVIDRNRHLDDRIIQVLLSDEFHLTEAMIAERINLILDRDNPTLRPTTTTRDRTHGY